jgi:hypothetical protein
MGLAGQVRGTRRKALQRISDDERRGPATPMRPKGCDSATTSAALVLLHDGSDIAVVGPPSI